MMSGITSLQKALGKANCTSDELEVFLEQDASSVNEMDEFGRRPLNLGLRNPKCSVDIVKTLLDYGAKVDLPDRYGYSALYTAIKSGVKADVIKMLLSRGAGKAKINDQTPICYYLTHECDASIIKMLLDAGVDECDVHASPLQCVKCSKYPVKADVIKLLLDAGAAVNRVNKNGITLLYHTLRHCRYYTPAVKLLLDHPEMNINETHPYSESSLLHASVCNRHCRFGVVKCLIDKGARVDAVNAYHNTPLHFAAMGCPRRVIKLLLKKGSPVNERNAFGLTPLQMAVRSNFKLDTCKLLLDAGARIQPDVFQLSLSRYDKERSEENLERFHTLLKYSFLRSPDVNIQNLIQGRSDYGQLSHLAKECMVELQNMQCEKIGPNLTLRDFVGRHSGIQMDAAEDKQDYDFNQLLKILGNNAFPLYIEVILAKVKRSLMVTKLEEHRIYAAKRDPDLSCVKGKINLDYASVWIVAQFLPNNDLFNLIMAYPNSEDRTTRDHPKHTNLVSKKSPEKYVKSAKRSRRGL